MPEPAESALPAPPQTEPWAAVAAAVATTERATADVRARVAAALAGGRTAAPAGSPAAEALLADVDEARRVEWASQLADPVLPRFAPTGDRTGVELSFAAPAEQGLWRDLTLASRVAAAVRASEARYEAAFDSAPAALLVAAASVDGRPQRVLSANAATARLLGYSRAQLLDLWVADLAPDGFASAVAHPDADPAAVVCCWRAADGSDVPLRVRAARVRGSAEIVLQLEEIERPQRRPPSAG